MKKQSLCNGDIVYLRDMNKYLVLKDAKLYDETEDLLINLTRGTFLRLQEIREEDIAKLCSCEYVGDNIREHIIEKENFWTWEEEKDFTEMTIAELGEKLGYKIKIVNESD